MVYFLRPTLSVTLLLECAAQILRGVKKHNASAITSTEANKGQKRIIPLRDEALYIFAYDWPF